VTITEGAADAAFAVALVVVLARCVLRRDGRLLWAPVAATVAAAWVGPHTLPAVFLLLFLAAWVWTRPEPRTAGRWFGALSAGAGAAAALETMTTGTIRSVKLGPALVGHDLVPPYAWLAVLGATVAVAVLTARGGDLPLHAVLAATVVGFGAATAPATHLGSYGPQLAVLLLAAAAWLPQAGTGNPPSGASLPVSAALGLCSLEILALLADRATLSARILATACVAAAIVRALVGEVEGRRLERSRNDALIDDLTGLGNRRRLAGAVTTALRTRAPHEHVGLVLLALDRFREVDDTFGHEIGDALLREVGARLSAVAGPHVLVRMGDEFALLVGPTENGFQAQAAAHALVRALDLPVPIGDLELRARASAGVALVPQHAADSTELMRCADVAMYEAKTAPTGDGVALFDADGARRTVVRRTDELRVGVARGDLVVHYQPEVDLTDGSIVGVEALVRWRHPTEGLLSPERFLSLAEQADLMPALTRIVLDTALEHARKLAEGGHPLMLAVNLSPSCLLDPHLPRVVGELMARYGVLPGQLTLELTEDALLPDPGHAADVIAALRAHGARLALDDFGTGFASLSYLRTFDVDAIKLDRSFVGRADSSPRDRIIVQSTIELGHSLGLSVVGEGVETESTYRTLQDMGCDLAQGYLIGEPMSYSDLKRFLLARGPGLAPTAAPRPQVRDR
jgi:diguanylate cyclase (GGDEF)-like protein